MGMKSARMRKRKGGEGNAGILSLYMVQGSLPFPCKIDHIWRTSIETLDIDKEGFALRRDIPAMAPIKYSVIVLDM